jgi:hypothetical protein
MNPQHKYLEQFERVRRWYQQFQEVSQGRLHDKPSDFYQDIVYAYFMNCYHLKDWIKNDPASSSSSAKVENFINTTSEMALCADICNGLKHLVFNGRYKPRSGQNPQFGKKHFKVSLGTQPTTIAIEYTIDTASGPVDAFNLATKCLEAWETFLQ